MMSDEEKNEATPTVKPKELNKELHHQITAFINRKAADPNDKCVVCGSPLNHVLPTEYSVVVQPDEGAVASGLLMPLYVTACRNCGFVRLFSKNYITAILADEAEKTAGEGTDHGD